MLTILDEVSRTVATDAPAVIHHNVVVSQVAQAKVDHLLGSAEQQTLIHIAVKRVPVVPSHLWDQIEAIVRRSSRDDDLRRPGRIVDISLLKTIVRHCLSKQQSRCRQQL